MVGIRGRRVKIQKLKILLHILQTKRVNDDIL